MAIRRERACVRRGGDEAVFRGLEGNFFAVFDSCRVMFLLRVGLVRRVVVVRVFHGWGHFVFRAALQLKRVCGLFFLFQLW